MPPKYPLPWRLVLKALPDFIFQRSRSFRADSKTCVDMLAPKLQIIGQANIPQAGPALVTVNHYSRPGFRAWWLPLAISASVPVEIHWVMTAAWRFEERRFRQQLTSLSRWAFRRISTVYAFTNMPPMPPDPSETEDRAGAVRRVLAYARSSPTPVIGLAPEGHDSAGGGLQPPPSGVGRFLVHLGRLGMIIHPVGAFETEQALCLRFGHPYCLDMPSHLAPELADRLVSDIIMQNIAVQLPDYLRGVYRKPLQEPLERIHETSHLA